MPKCPTCGATFSNEKLLKIHKKYCGQQHKKMTDSDAKFSTARIRRSEIMDSIEKKPQIVPDIDEPSALDIASGLPVESPAEIAGEMPGKDSEDDSNSFFSDIYENSRGRLKLGVKRHKSVLLVKIQGDLVVWTSLQLNSGIKQLLELDSRFIVLEVTEVKECDATGLGALILFNQELKDRGGRLALATSKEHRGKFECIKGFTRVIDFFDSLEDAVKDFLGE